jgi:hypothetical protein
MPSAAWDEQVEPKSSTAGSRSSRKPGAASRWSPIRSSLNLIAATTTKTGLRVRSRVDDRIYAKGRRVSNKQLAAVNLEPQAFHGEWNYIIRPTAST